MTSIAILLSRGLVSDKQVDKLGPMSEPDEPEESQAPEAEARDVETLLQQGVASAIDLWAQCKQSHWNVVGPNFIGAHRLLDEVGEGVEDLADTFAERLRQLGKEAKGLLPEVLKATQVQPGALGVADEKAHLKAISERLQAFCDQCDEGAEESGEAEDLVTQNIFIDAAQECDQLHYLVASHLGK